MSKKLIAWLVALGMCFSLTSCADLLGGLGLGGESSLTSSELTSSDSEEETPNNSSDSNSESDDNNDNENEGEKQYVTVTFKQAGEADVVKTVEKFTSLTDIPTPKAKTGYTVDTENWYIDAGCSIVATFTNLQENITVYAKASANKYTVTYNANGGLVANATQEVVFDADYTLETPTHTESYMRFDGWKDAENNTISLTGKWTTDRDMSLTAQWTDTREIYTISFVQAGQETKTFSVKEGESFTEIPTPTAKIGYTVVWNKNEFTNVTENITVMAIETAKTYTIILNANGGNVSQTTFTVTYGQAYEFEKPIHNENAFISWKYNGEKVALSGVWDIDIESGEGELLAEWGDSIWSKNY